MFWKCQPLQIMNHIDESDNVCEELKMLLPSPPIPDKELSESLHLNLNQIYIFLCMLPNLMSNFNFIHRQTANNKRFN